MPAAPPLTQQSPPRAEHFKRYFYAAVLHVLEQVARALGSYAAAFEQFPFLVGYNNELTAHGLSGAPASEAARRWRESLWAWEAQIAEHLPLRALREAAALDHETLTLWLSIGLSEEDARFGLLYETLQGTPGERRPTLALLSAWWSEGADHSRVRAQLRQLRELGLLRVVNPEQPRSDWALQIPPLLWDALHGVASAAWLRVRARAELTPLAQLIVPAALSEQLARLPQMLAADSASALIVRGPQRNGRRTVLGATARALGRGVLEVGNLHALDQEAWRLLGPLATLLHALPVLVCDPAPGETVELPQLNCYTGPLGVALNRHGGLNGAAVERAFTLTLEPPAAAARREHWQAGCGAQALPAPTDLAEISERYRLTSGNIRRAAKLAAAAAHLAGRATITIADVQQASRHLNRQALDTLAKPVTVAGDWSRLAVSASTLAELYHLERRCRHRERLPATVSPALRAQLNTGVRALFGGPSGTGKTLAAGLLAAVLQMDVYRVDLSAVVNKYIGETEKNLNQIFARAEELDVILLLDEGDALLTQRTNVQTANDRYANLETNYLLQRLETFAGILIVTTNASERIDGAFQRRMDVVIDFRLPEATERWAIWQLHLLATHAVDESLLREIAGRCQLSGGQIRNAVLHASLLALSDDGALTSAHLEAAVQREYRKMGALCPLRRAPALARAHS